MLHRSKKRLHKARFLLDENIPKTVHQALVDFDSVWVGRDMPSAPDIEIYRRALDERRIIITLDRDFVQLRLFQTKKPKIVLLRFAQQNPKLMAERLLWLIRNMKKWGDGLMVLSESHLLVYQ